MEHHEYPRKILPLWKALVDIERLAFEAYFDQNHKRAFDIGCIARDTIQHFTATEQDLAETIAKEASNGNNTLV